MPPAILVELPIAVKSPNRVSPFSRGAAMARRLEVARTRDLARAATLRMLGLARLAPSRLLPATITFTRISAGELDDDNLAASCKACRDGVCKALGIEDGRKSPAVFAYAQRRGPRGKPGLEVLIARREDE